MGFFTDNAANIRRIGFFIAVSLLIGEPVFANSTLSVFIDLTQPQTGSAKVTLEFSEGTRISKFVKPQNPDEIEFLDIQVLHDNFPVPYTMDERNVLLAKSVSGSYEISYRVKPGGMGRHGLQGIIDKRFAGFDGRVFMQPQWLSVENITLRVFVPDNWETVLPFQKLEDHYVVSQSELPPFSYLQQAVYLFGPFNTRYTFVGNTKLAVSTFRQWPQDYQKQLVRNSTKLFKHFHEKFHFEPAQYFISWTPASAEDQKVFGGSWAYGTQMEMPKNRFRNWELLAHRIAHGINKYTPTGMLMTKKEDQWFNEGWASFMEITSTSDAGIAKNQYRWNYLYRKYLSVKQHHPQIDVPLADESDTEGDITEYLHYTKAPLIVKALDYHISDAYGKNIMDFMSTMYTKYGHMTKGFPFRRELEKYVGASLEEFWELNIRKTGEIVPLWPEYQDIMTGQPTSEPVVIVNEEYIPESYIRFLLSNGEFEYYSDIIHYLIREINLINIYKKKQLNHFPNFLLTRLEYLPPATRYRLHQKLNQHIKLSSVNAQVQYAPNKLGELFERLVQTDEAYQNYLGKHNIKNIAVKQKNKRTLLITDRSPFKVYYHWLDGGFSAKFEILDESDNVVDSRELGIETHWRYSFSEYKSNLADKESIIYMNVESDGQTLVKRGFWYTPSPKTAKSDE